jgi:hypothetical protein
MDIPWVTLAILVAVSSTTATLFPPIAPLRVTQWKEAHQTNQLLLQTLLF